jgi:CubicO group peptidase (beta-lactamase class C family)
LFQKSLSNYATFSHYQIGEKSTKTQFDELFKKIDRKVVVVGLGKLNNVHSKNYGITPQMEAFIRELHKEKEVVVVHFGNAYSTGILETLPSIVCAFEWNEFTQSLVPEVLFGAIKASGKMPVSAGLSIKYGVGFSTPDLERFRFGEPEEVGLRSDILAKIDSFANSIIAEKMTPGCQILVAKDGAVIYNKGFGFQTYDSLVEVSDQTLYDIASITKVAATLQGVMYLQERSLLNLWDKASSYLPELKGTNKEQILIADILVHQAGLQPFIPYWKRTLRTPVLGEIFYCDEKDNWFDTEVVPGLYSMKSMEDTVWKWVVQSEMMPKNKKGGYDYKYSDLGYYILKRLVERVLNEPIDVFLEKRYFQPLGLERLCFKPKRFFPELEIAPTEDDTLFRRCTIRGNVHDQGAAMFGGVAGHAGLFSNAYSLAVLMQMNMNFGYYGGRYMHLPQTVPYFAQRHFPRNRRGLGWDKPFQWSKDGPTSQYCSQETFGHTGFTGTCVWADPKHKLIFVFLSNRVYPDAENGKLIKNNIRPRMHDIVYQAFEDFQALSKIVPQPDSAVGH